MAKFTVIYDACVLYPAPLRDLLLQLATANLFRAKWTDEIHDEWVRNVIKDRPDLKLERLAITRQRMNAAVLDSLVVGYEYLIPAIELPDENDRHVVAAALQSRADAIVTYNLKDFPAVSLKKYNLEAIHPDEFINYQIDLETASVLGSVQQCRERLNNPPKSAEEYLDTLEKLQLPKSMSRLRQYAKIL